VTIPNCPTASAFSQRDTFSHLRDQAGIRSGMTTQASGLNTLTQSVGPYKVCSPRATPSLSGQAIGVLNDGRVSV
jgi:hypothetical protein